jgi:predicted P-loop ATPase/GTPase
LPLILPSDNTQHEERNTDFYTVGNIDWYDQTDFSVVLETYWVKTQFLTEKSFKPIIAQHPFINIGNNTTQLLKHLGFDIFEDVINYTASSTLDRINQFRPVTFDIDPRRLSNNLTNMHELRQIAIEEQYELVDRLEDSLTN